MSIESLKSALPDYAKDLKLNLASVAAEAALTDQQRWGALVATAIASRNPAVIRAVEAEAQVRLSPEALAAAKTAAAIMASAARPSRPRRASPPSCTPWR